MIAERPSVRPALPWSPPPPTLVRLEGVADLYVHVDRTLPIVSLRAQLPIGSVDDPADRPGLVALATAMMQEESGSFTSLQRAAAFDRLAARFSAGPGKEWSTVALDVHRDRLDAALPLFADALVAPRFVESDWNRVRERHVTGITQGLDDNGFVSAQVTPVLLFGPDHPYGHAVHGTIEGIEAASLAECRSAWSRIHDRGVPAMAIVGDIDVDVLAARIGALFQQVGGRVRAPVPVVTPRPGRWFVDSPGSAQTNVRVAMPGPAGLADDRIALDLARVVLGGSFTSRLNRRLREEKGYTYGARLAVGSWRSGGAISASASVQADATAPALTDMLEVLRVAVDGGFTDEEISRARAQSLQDLVEVGESRAGLAATYANEFEAGRSPEALAGLGELVANVTREQVEAAARKWLDPSAATVVLVGDGAAVAASLDAFGVWTTVDPFGRALSAH